ncbi:hypothetical protein [Streptomyces lavendulae]|uniref:hypothetical protein n=1 Tax=Streptomyces lavendulae TaxID=1914 RepID=UPI0025569CF1|nr:hypothetical protein [Streptomyces lavendulae]
MVDPGPCPAGQAEPAQLLDGDDRGVRTAVVADLGASVPGLLVALLTGGEEALHGQAAGGAVLGQGAQELRQDRFGPVGEE